MEEKYDVKEFWKFHLKVGEIKHAEKIPKTKKLIKLQVDLGNEQRTIIAGIGDQYTPQDLQNKKMIFVTNLKPKKLAGTLSNGMLLVAEEESGKIHLITLPKHIPNGTKIW
jgi:tRNA-binding protein